MASKSEIQKELDLVMGQLSTRVRTLAFGTFAFTCGLFVSNSPSTRVDRAAERAARRSCIIAVMMISFDFLQ